MRRLLRVPVLLGALALLGAPDLLGAQAAAQDRAPPAQDPPAQPEPAPAQDVPAAGERETVEVRRLSDVVAVREGARSPERVLYYFNPTIRLAEGDHVEQGSAGHSEITLPGGGLLQLNATAHLVLDKLAPEGDVLRLTLATSLEATARERPLRLLLPGGVACDILETGVRALLVPGRMALRNTGSQPVVLGGQLRLEREGGDPLATTSLVLQRGEGVRVVLVAGAGEPDGAQVDLWGALPVRHDGGLRLEHAGDQLRPSPEGEADPAALRLTVRGVRTVPRPGLVLRNPAHLELPASPPPPPADEDPAIEAAILESLRQLGALEDAPAPEPDDDAEDPGDEPR